MGTLVKATIWVLIILFLSICAFLIIKKTKRITSWKAFPTYIGIVIAIVGLIVEIYPLLKEADEEEAVIAGEDVAKLNQEEIYKEVRDILAGQGEEQVEVVKSILENLKKRMKNENIEEYIQILSNCGKIEYDLGYIIGASELTEEAVDYVEKLEVTEDNYPLISLCNENRALVLQRQGEAQEAENYFWKAVRLYEEKNDKCLELASLYIELAEFYLSDAYYTKAGDIIGQAVEILEQLNKTNSIEMGVVHMISARVYEYLDQSRVIDELTKAKSILERNKPRSDRYLLSLYGYLGAYYWYTDKSEAESYFYLERELGRELKNEFSPEIIEAEINLAHIYAENGQLQRSRNNLEGIISKCEERYDELDIDGAYANVSLGGVLYELERYDESIECYENALRVFELNLKPTHPDIAQAYSGIASARWEKGQTQEAIRDLNTAIEKLETNGNMTQKDIAELLQKKATFICLSHENLKEAIPLYEEARGIYQNLYGETSEKVMRINLEMGQVYIGMKNANSYEMLSEAVERYRMMYGDNSYQMIDAYISLGDCFYNELGRGDKDTQLAKAIACYDKAGDILKLFDKTNAKQNSYRYEKLGTAWYLMDGKEGMHSKEEINKSNMEKSLQCYQKAQDIYRISGKEDELENLWLWARIARVYAYLENEKKAEECLTHTEEYVSYIIEESMQFQIYLDMLATCAALKERDKCREYAQYLMTFRSYPEITGEVETYCWEWINTFT